MEYCICHITVHIMILLISMSTVPGSPNLSVSPSSVVVGGSVTFTCTFTQAPLISADIRSTDGGFICTFGATSDGMCTGSTGSGCTGNSPSCSADKKTYTLTVNSVPETWNGKTFICKDTIIDNDNSQEVQISTIGSPKLSVSPSSVVVGGSITFTCTFTQAPLISADITSTDGGFACQLEAAGDGTCTGSTGSGCAGSTPSCSADKMTYSLTVKSVPGTWNGKEFFCRDTIYINQDSQFVTITIIVPPTTVRITPLGNVVNIVAGETAIFTCTTDATRPQSNITWYRDNVAITGTTQRLTNANGGKFITTNVLTLSGDRNAQEFHIHCTAINLQGGSPVSSLKKSIIMKYPPIGKPRFINPILTYNASNIVILTCQITSNGNPSATWVWVCGSTTFPPTDFTSSGVQSTLTFIANKSNNEEKCWCRAKSSIGSFNMTSDPVSLNIQYPPTGKPKFISSILTYNTGDVAELTCRLTSYGNPPEIWIWKCGSRTLIQNEVYNSKGQSTARFTVRKDDDGVQCTCNATSPIGPFESVSDHVVVNVHYPPIRGLQSSTESVTVLSHDEKINLFTYFMSNPYPSIQWYFRSNTSTALTNLKNESATSTIVQTVGNNSYKSVVNRDDPSASDFGEYVLVIQNRLGILIFQFMVFIEDIPCTPTNVFIDCSTTSIAILSWSTECNRQKNNSGVTYNILSKEQSQTEFTVHGHSKIHIGKSGQLAATINQLSSGEWIFKIHAKNRLGSTESKDISCHITPQGSIQQSHSLDGKSLGAGVGITIGIICCLGVAAYFVLKLRKRSAETSHEHSQQHKEYQSSTSSPYDVIPAETRDSRAYSELNIDTSLDREMKVYENAVINDSY